MSFWAEPAAAGMALTRTLSINAKLATFTLSLLVFIFLLFCFMLHSCLFAVFTIENNYCRNTTNNEILQFM